jgi:hypothetical protein
MRPQPQTSIDTLDICTKTISKSCTKELRPIYMCDLEVRFCTLKTYLIL